MSTLTVALLSALGAIFLLLFLAGIATLVWLALDIRRVQNKTREQMVGNQQETKTTFDSAKSSFAAIRAETKALLDEHRKQTVVLLEEHRKAMQATIEKINAEALSAAAVRCMEACQQLGKTISVFQRLILENTEQRMPNEYGPEEFAPETAEFGGPPSRFSVGLAAQSDAEAEREVASLTQSGPDR